MQVNSRAGSDAQQVTDRVTRGVCRMLTELGYETLREFRVGTNRRVDVIGLNSEGEFVIVEVKSSAADYRSDRKWHEYLDFCEKFYFAVPEDFPENLLPEDCGLMVADGFGGVVRRQSSKGSMNGNRKRSQLVRFALTAGSRLRRAYES
jgi:hypothetical protein